jgi:uncharacterized protein YegL
MEVFQMKNGATELVFILDKSGSMAGLESDTIGGFNGMLRDQQKMEGECRITTVLFDDRYELLHDRIDIRAVRPISDKEYQVGGYTALLDAVGKTIKKIDKAQKNTAIEYRASKVMFVIITDGEENASRAYASDEIKGMIEAQKQLGREFIFLGANIDAVATAKSFGIAEDRAQNFHADKEGVELNFEVMSDAIKMVRVNQKLDSDWNVNIREDFEKRKK